MSNVIKFGESVGAVGLAQAASPEIEFTYYDENGELLAQSGISPIPGFYLNDKIYTNLAVSALFAFSEAALSNEILKEVAPDVVSVGVGKNGGPSVLARERVYREGLSALDDGYCEVLKAEGGVEDVEDVEDADLSYDAALLRLKSELQAVYDAPFSGAHVGREFYLEELGARINSDLASTASSQRRSTKLFSIMHSLAVSPAKELAAYDKGVREDHKEVDQFFNLELSYPY